MNRGKGNRQASILVVDDDPNYREALRRALVLEGYEVRLACDGDAGLESFRAAPADLVVVDLFMPGREGLATIRELKREAPDLPVIVVSGAPERGLPELMRMAQLQGALRTLAKPFDEAELVAAVRELLAR